MDKLKMHSKDMVQAHIEQIGALFPNCVTETVRDGKVVRAIDFDMLRQELSDVVVEGPTERYQFAWPDKRKSILAANAPISATLRPCREESVDFDNTENLYIEGDNLDVLKLLQETYLGKVKMIYIDPPYNTGNDFVYEDDFSESADAYMGRSGQYDEQGNRLVTNAETNGRFHTDWLNMILPRLRLAKTLLTDDGIIFISIEVKSQFVCKFLQVILLQGAAFSPCPHHSTAGWHCQDRRRRGEAGALTGAARCATQAASRRCCSFAIATSFAGSGERRIAS